MLNTHLDIIIVMYQTGARNAYVCDRQIQQAYIKPGLEMPKKKLLKK